MLLLLVRHGVTRGNAERVFMGHDPVPLSPQGREQISRLAERLRGEAVARIVASDVLRARESAEIIASSLGLTFETDSALREVDVGRAKGLTYEEAAVRWPGILAPEGDARFPGGESFADVADRATTYLQREVLREGAGSTLVVAHGGVIRGVAARLLGKLLSEVGAVDNASMTAIRVEGERAVLVAWNDTAHLGGSVRCRKSVDPGGVGG